jgi:glycine cleavage system transcriptional repressor
MSLFNAKAIMLWILRLSKAGRVGFRGILRLRDGLQNGYFLVAFLFRLAFTKEYMQTTPLQLVISSVGSDRPGLVALMCEVISMHQGNIDDSTMTLLGGQFAMIYIVTFPDEDAVQAFSEACQILKEQENLHLGFNRLNTITTSCSPSVQASSFRKYLLSVGGYDRTGITYAFSRALADLNINITDVNAHRLNGEAGIVYMLAIEMDAPATLDEQQLKKKLDTLGREMKLDVRLRSMDAMIL